MGYFVEPQRDNFQKAVDGYLGRRLSSHCPAFKQGIWGNPYQQCYTKSEFSLKNEISIFS
ncbi:MAG: hypothetical protein COU25_02870 [Candidatus Levybacteria bacterium CG10_big_fil_rev_8_21_14_0_10_35_13]|nr:MAG: hypothetical protein COU25_02870 [Candidatus Levybacteria bacterium CG10_big_fil_rev_8_21_14_0_10_35_13]